MRTEEGFCDAQGSSSPSSRLPEEAARRQGFIDQYIAEHGADYPTADEELLMIDAEAFASEEMAALQGFEVDDSDPNDLRGIDEPAPHITVTLSREDGTPQTVDVADAVAALTARGEIEPE